jgi:hypothetical protein
MVSVVGAGIHLGTSRYPIAPELNLLGGYAPSHRHGRDDAEAFLDDAIKERQFAQLGNARGVSTELAVNLIEEI